MRWEWIGSNKEAALLWNLVFSSVKYPPHQFFSIESTKKDDRKIPAVSTISIVEFSLLTVMLF
jgi:hypothetical protein